MVPRKAVMIITTFLIFLIICCREEALIIIQNAKWCKAVTKSFNGVTRLVKDVEQYRRKRTMPLTWKGHTDNTRYLQ